MSIKTKAKPNGVKMQVQRIQSNNNQYNPNFKSVIIEKSAEKLIDNMSKSERKEFDNIVKRLADTKFWDMKISKIPRDIDEFWCTFVNKRTPKKVYELGINPIEAKGSKVEFYPMLAESDSKAEILKFSSPERAQAMMDMRKKHSQELLQRNYKSTNLQRLTNWANNLEFLDEAYRYMKSGEVYPFNGKQNTIKKQTVWGKVLNFFGIDKKNS